jgi:hypothetical protein
MTGLGSRDNQRQHPYTITYMRGDKLRSRDTAPSVDGAKFRIEKRLAKRHNKGEVARVFLGHELVFQTPN